MMTFLKNRLLKNVIEKNSSKKKCLKIKILFYIIIIIIYHPLAVQFWAPNSPYPRFGQGEGAKTLGFCRSYRFTSEGFTWLIRSFHTGTERLVNVIALDKSRFDLRNQNEDSVFISIFGLELFASLKMGTL